MPAIFPVDLRGHGITALSNPSLADSFNLASAWPLDAVRLIVPLAKKLCVEELAGQLLKKSVPCNSEIRGGFKDF